MILEEETSENIKVNDIKISIKVDISKDRKRSKD
jgi:hypothetical protein